MLQRARLFFKTTCSYTCVTSWQYSFYTTIARLIPFKLVLKFAIVSCTYIVASYNVIFSKSCNNVINFIVL